MNTIRLRVRFAGHCVFTFFYEQTESRGKYSTKLFVSQCIDNTKILNTLNFYLFVIFFLFVCLKNVPAVNEELKRRRTPIEWLKKYFLEGNKITYSHPENMARLRICVGCSREFQFF